jgi:multidrug efflux pump subunit AcrA (membrane-fusion protein)
MNGLDAPPALKGPPPRPLLPPPDRDTPGLPPSAPARRSGSGRLLLGIGVLGLLIGALALGASRHYAQHRQVVATAQQETDVVPSVRVEEVVRHQGRVHVALPGTTLAFEQANVFARASGYIAKRYVDIGDHVNAGQLLAEITAPEVDHQIAQFQNSLQQAEATRRQNEANRSLAQVTWGRDAVLVNQGWATQQQGDTDRYNFHAQQQATQAAGYNAAAMKPS